MAVPIHVWQPPQLESTVGQRVVISGVVGPGERAAAIKSTLIAATPRDAGRETELVDFATLQSRTDLQLVSATDDQPSDLAIASVARREGIDYVLRGEILKDCTREDCARSHHHPTSDQATERFDGQPLTVSWRLMSLSDNRSAGGKPVSVELTSAIDRYPDLGFLDDPNAVLTSAVVRDSFRLITPWVGRQRVQLAIPYLLAGSKQVRRGNAAALSGDWAQAASIWAEVARQHPSQVAAIHNLSLAAAAAQQFSTAKQLARKAIHRQPTGLNKNTLAWIEMQQRQYHQAFNLPDPPEGWFVTGD